MLTRWFRKDCRSAKGTFRRLLMKPQPTSHSAMITGLRELAEYRDRLDAFSSNLEFHAVAGPHYLSIDTPWSDLLGASEWLATAARQLQSERPELVSLLASMPPPEINSLREQALDQRSALEAARRLDQLIESTRNTSQALQIPWNDSIEQLEITVRDVAEKVSQLLRCAYQSGLKRLLTLDHAKVLADLCRREAAAASEADRLASTLSLSDSYRGPETDVVALQKAVKFATEIDRSPLPAAVSKWLLRDFDIHASVLTDGISTYLDRLSEFEQALVTLVSVSRANVAEAWGHEDIHSVPFNVFIPLLERALDFADDLPMYIDWLRGWRECLVTTLPELPRLVVDGAVPTEALPLVHEYVFYNSLVNNCLAAHSDLMLFKGLAHERLQSIFRDLDREVMVLNAKRAAWMLDSWLIPHGCHSGSVSQWTDLALIRHELTKQKRHIPIRRLVNRSGHALKALKPCFMMSPLSVAQYLEPSHLQFDLVIMDEASQLKPEDALGAIARGKQVVVVGDPKQLPPTTFFERTNEDGEAGDEDLTAAEDAESILDVASSVYQPARRLRWHYRSRHHSLIEFSNHEFYKNLIVFPSAYSEHPELGVKLTEVSNGRFVNRRNLPEAQMVVSAAMEHMRLHPNESLGIVALNFEQRELIDDLLDHEAISDPSAEAFIARWGADSEPLFVKNLENVQGDERDVIFISTTYGPNESGRQFQRFGPINGATGHRRLNVLFTRAKKRVQVFSSLQAANILTDNASWGVKVLRQYLEFAKSGTIREISTGSHGGAESDFEIAVIDVLKASGYDVVPQVGVAGFFIDIGVREQSNSGVFLAGIECDGAAYHSAKSARDRDRLRQEILESHGWRIYRIWSTDWFKNRRHEETRLLQFLSAARLEGVRNNSK